MRKAMPHAFGARDEVNVPIRFSVIEHERRNPRGIGPIGKHYHVEHQPQLLRMIWWVSFGGLDTS